MISDAPKLPMPWVDKIFLTLTLLHGRDFLGRWEGVPIEEVKLDWAERLACFVSRPEAIGYALDNLHDNKAPTVLDFRTVCLRCPVPVLVALEAPAADPARVAAEFGKMAASAPLPKAAPLDHKGWAKKIIARHSRGEKVNLTPLRFAREALGMAVHA